jgi:hypothetical protein
MFIVIYLIIFGKHFISWRENSEIGNGNIGSSQFFSSSTNQSSQMR